MKYRCLICGHIYDEEKEGVKFADLPADWKCPTCKQPKEKFVPVEDEMTWAAEHVVPKLILPATRWLLPEKTFH